MIAAAPSVRRWCRLFSGVSALAIGLTSSQAAGSSPMTWEQVTHKLGKMRLDGTLALRWEIVAASDSPFATSIALEHEMKTNWAGRAQTSWRFEGLTCSIVSAGPGQLVWRTLRGTEETFERAEKPVWEAETGSAGSLLRQTGDQQIEIMDAARRCWRFSHGVLQEMRNDQTGERVHFVAESPWFKEAKVYSPAGHENLALSVSHNLVGQPEEVVVRGKRHRFEWNREGQLCAWQRPDGSVVDFEYRDGLIAKIAETGSPPMVFRWEENPGHNRGDSLWRAAAHLVSDGVDFYDYRWSRRGYIIDHYGADHRLIAEATYNPWRHLVRLKAGADLVELRLDSRVEGPGPPQR